jgi:hypothetical protein
MPVQTEKTYFGDVVKREFDPLYTRETVTVSSGQNLVVGSVVGIVTATGKAKLLTPAATDGSQTAVGVLAVDVDATSADTKGVIIARGPCVLSDLYLTYPVGITAPQKATALSQLKALGLITRQTV